MKYMLSILVLHQNLLTNEEKVLEMDQDKAEYYTKTAFKNEKYTIYIPPIEDVAVIETPPIIEVENPIAEISEPVVELPIIVAKKTKKNGTIKPAEDHNESAE